MRKHRSIPKDLEALAARFAKWRRRKASPQEKIPEKLWARATALARRHGISLVTGHLHLGRADLKARLAGKASRVSKRRGKMPPVTSKIVKLTPLIVSPSPQLSKDESTVEIEGPNGWRLRAAGAEAEAALRAFVEACHQ